MKRLVVLAGLAAMLFGTAACGGPTTGQPTPATTADSTGSTPSSNGESGEPSSSTGGSGSLPVDDACSLLPSDAVSKLGLSSPPSPDNVGTAPDCSLDMPDYSVGVDILTNAGLNDFKLVGGTAQDLTIGSHSAKQGVDNTKSCVIGIGVTSSSRVDVTGTGNGNTDPCPTALAVARLVEPNLP